MKDLIIIESPSNLGLKEPSPGHPPGVRGLPAWLNAHGLYDRLAPAAVYPLTPPAYTGILDPETGVRNADAIVRFAREQANLLQEKLRAEVFPLVLGGDCSILIGNALALKEKGRFGLFFLDGHTDYSWPGLSETGGAAGMDFAIAVGRGPDKLTAIDNRKPYFNETDCWNVGNRDYDPAYVKEMTDSGIPYWDLNRLRREGIAACVSSFLERVDSGRLDGFWIHLDVDVLNDDLMPAVDSRSPDGLHYNELTAILQPLLVHPKCTGLELTILDPELDPGGTYTRPFVKAITALLLVRG